MAYAVPTKTAQNVMDSVRTDFGDIGGVQLTDAQIIAWINDAQDELNNRNKILKATATSATVVGQGAYTFPTQGILQVESLFYDLSLLRNVDFAQAQATIIHNTTTEGNSTPQLWYEWAGTVVLYPAPDAVKTLTLYYTQNDTPVTSAASVLGLPDKYYQDICRYVLARAYISDENYEAAAMVQAQIESSVTRMVDDERTAQSMYYPRITIVDD